MDELLGTIVSAIEDKKGKNILSLDLRGFDGAVADAFVVCSAESTTQVAAIADGIEEKVFETLGQRPRRTEGMQNAIWVVVDYVDIMVHVSRRRPASSTGWRSFGPTPPRCATASGSNKMRINALMFRGMSVGRMPHQYCRT